jgi:hypothetical protein
MYASFKIVDRGKLIMIPSRGGYMISPWELFVSLDAARMFILYKT